jgi:PAS domain S-box-containing protein
MVIREEKKRPAFADGMKVRNFRIFLIIFSIIIVSASGIYLNYSWNRYQEIASSEAILLAESLESLLHTEHIAKLSGSAEDLEKPEYLLTKLSLSRLVENSQISFAYIMGEKDGRMIFLLDSEPLGSPGYSPPGQVYEEADDIVWKPFKTAKTVLTAPRKDRWGTWINALVPVIDPADGSVIAVFGIDYSASEWHTRLQQQMIPDIIVVISVLIFIGALLRVWYQHFVLKNLSSKLSFNEALYYSLFEQAPIGIAIVNDSTFEAQSELGYTSINPMFEQILGRTSEELKNKKWTEITHPDDLQADLEKFEQFKAGKINGYSMEKRFIKPDGSIVWVQMVVGPLTLTNDYSDRHICLIQDITQRKEIEKELVENERSKSVLLSHLPGLAYRCNYDREWTMQYISQGCFKLTGYNPDSLLYNKELSYNDLITPKYRERLWNEWKRVLDDRLPFKYEYEIITATGEKKWVLEMGEGVYNEQGEVEAIEGIVLDISDRKQIEDNVRYNSEHDIWTDLYNRRYFESLLTHDAKKQTDRKRALVCINLNTIHILRQTYGFQYSQEVIKKVADALKLYCSKKRQLFNISEYYFIFYVKPYQEKDELAEFCTAISQTLEPILAIERIGGGIGVVEIADYIEHNVDQLLTDVLIASKKAINVYDNDIGVCFFDKELEAEIIRDEHISRELTQITAGENVGRLFLQYQPVLDLKTNKICGFEALARLNSVEFGRIEPLRFISIAERTKVIIPLGEIIIRKALLFLKSLNEKGYDSISISINISPIQLFRSGFAENLMEMIKEIKLDPEQVCLEITESAFVSGYLEMNRILGKLKSYGFKIAIDDFGTGYSSLAWEQELNINCLKIDKFFIDKLLTLSPDEAMTGDIISMAHRLGHCVIAEGVEYESQRQYLQEHGCDKIQGYLIGKPLDEEAVFKLLTETNPDKNA